MTELKARLEGKVVIRPLSDVTKNPWNPNRMTDAMKASLKHGFLHDGWLVSQALLIWGIDSDGTVQNIIIDGEHRWTAGLELDMPEGPMVFLDGLTEAQAKALTIKMNQKRGEFVTDMLGSLLKELEADLDVDDLGLDLGFDDETIMGLMANEPVDLETGEGTAHQAETQRGNATETADAGMRSSGTHVRLIQLFFDVDQHSQFVEAIKALGAKYGTKNVTETALQAVLELTKEPTK